MGAVAAPEFGRLALADRVETPPPRPVAVPPLDNEAATASADSGGGERPDSNSEGGASAEVELPPEFNVRRFHVVAGIGPTEMSRVFDDDDATLVTYRGFASIIGIVAALVASVVAVTGLAAATFLLFEKTPITAIGAFALSLFFALVVVMLVPPTNVTLLNGADTALTIAQTSRTVVPQASWTVLTPGGALLGSLEKALLARFGRNRWTIRDQRGVIIARAADETLGRAILRKLLGKFSRRYEADVHIDSSSNERVALIRRRPDSSGATDTLEVITDGIDRRLLLALAVLVLGSEP